MVGRLDRLKAPDLLLEALGLMRADLPGIRATFVGGSSREAPDGGDFAAWLRRRASELDIPVDLRGHQPREAVLEAYAECRALVVASSFESYSMVAAEAMAVGRPVVVTTACGIADLVTSVNPERVVPPGDPHALARALRPLLDDPRLAGREGRAARARVSEVCDPVKVAAQRLALYTELGALASSSTRLSSSSV
jgi:glycosyltransferase involved in cell wall biosynthesis